MYRRSPNSIIKHLDFLILDLICLIVSYILAIFIRHGNLSSLSLPSYRISIVIIFLLHICIAAFGSSYKNILHRGYLVEFLAVFRHVAFVFIGLLICIFFLKDYMEISRLIVICDALLSLALIYLERILWKKYLRSHMKKSSRIMLLVADRRGAKRVLDKVNERSHDFEIRGVVLTDDIQGRSGGAVCGVSVVADLDNLISYLEANPVDEILFSLPRNVQLPADLMQQCRLMGITIHVEIPSLDELPGARMEEVIAGITVLTSSAKMITAEEAFLKRALDICGGIFGLILTGILFIFVAPAIYITDPGPILFGQKRVGKNGRIFKLYKFRSMYQDAEQRKAELMNRNENNGLMFKMDNDPRIIGSGTDGKKHGVGYFIRKTSIDEFPQFWNVLKGDMSLVGTRPPTLEEWNEYDLHHRARLATKPGLTGLWQVSGRSDITDFEEVVRLDMEYIQKWSFWLDIKILLKTVIVVIKGDGSK